MAGLLYKDFVGIKGKSIIVILAGCTFLFLALRFMFPGNVTAAMSVGIVENEAGELTEITVGEFRDSFLAMLPMLFIVCSLGLASAWTAAICKQDEKNKARMFTGALPLDKNAYIASKYLFIGIAVYILFSLALVWIIIFNSVAGNDHGREVITNISGLLTTFYGLFLLLASVELPFFITLGVKKGNVIKTALLEGAAFLIAAYLFFGNLKIFKNFDIYIFTKWCEEHPVIVTAVSILSPVADLFIFWLSYRITCRINQNREVEING